ncbi:MAG: sulfatase [Proteobacteria bacterium]|jgi:arylsulfatase A-like enzyme|nr:sulfatase [Pseudomonadota bacterium]
MSNRHYLRVAIGSLGAGLVAGLGVACADSARLWIVAGHADWSLPGFGALLYGPLLALLGCASGLALAFLGRLSKRPAADPAALSGTVGLLLFVLFTIIVGAFYFQRDFFGEKAGLLSREMLLALAGLVVAVGIVGVGMWIALRRLSSGPRALLRKPWLPFAVYAIATLALVALWGALGGASGAGVETGPKPAQKRPNVLLVLSDAHRADHTGVYGGPKDLTPRLDAFAAEAVVFDRAFAQAPWTRPSVATILTGRYPSSHTATLKGSVLPDEVTTVAEVLAAGGYETMAIQTNFNLTPFFNFDQGFTDYSYLTPALPLGATDEQSKLIFVELAKKIQAKLAGSSERPEDYYVVGEAVTDEALARLDARDEARPFFLFVGYMDVHDPYFRHPYDGHAISHRANPSPDPKDAALVAEMKALYAGEVRYWDAHFGRLVDGLKKRGLYDETLVVVVSDHGEEFADHGGFWHGTTLYDEQLEVIFVAKYPASSGLPGGVRSDAWMRLLDVAPLIVDAAGLKIPAEMQGAPSPGNDARRPIFAETDHQGSVATSIRWVEDGRELKIVRANAGNPRGLEPVALYEVGTDPGETANLAGAPSPGLETGLEALDAMAIRAREGAARAETGELTAEQKRVLEQLGYMKKGE